MEGFILAATGLARRIGGTPWGRRSKGSSVRIQPDLGVASRWPKAGLLLFSGLCGLSLVFGGCIINRSVDTSALPSPWRTGIEGAPAGQADISGTYLDQGEVTAPNYSSNGRISSSHSLTSFLFEIRKDQPPAAEEVQFAQFGGDRLTCRLLRDGKPVWSEEMTISVEPKTGMIVLPTQSRSWVSPSEGEMAHGTQQIALLKGGDGHLYARSTISAAGVAVVIPVAGNIEFWGRWPVSTPEAVVQVREHARKQAALAPGKPFPDFEARDFEGGAVSTASYRGKVLVVHTLNLQDKVRLGAVTDMAKVYGQRRSAGLEFVSIIAFQPGKAAEADAALRDHGAPWIRLPDNQQPNGFILPRLGLDRPGDYLLVDRDGTIKARVRRWKDLEAPLASLLDPAPR